MAGAVFPGAGRATSHGKTPCRSLGMITPRPHLLAVLILSLVACSTQHLDGFDIYQPINPSNPSLVWLDSSLPAQMGHVRIKVDGKFLIYDYGASFSYIELYAGSARESVMITPGEQLDLVGSAGETLLHFEPPVPFSHPHRVWVHDSPTGFE